MNLRLIVPVVLALAGCRASHAYRVTPVAAVTTSAADEETLRAALSGEGWKIDRTIYEDGAEESESGIFHMEFDAKGGFVYRIYGKPQEFKYTLEGKNVVTTHPGVKTLRVDSINPNELKLFVYEMSLTWVLKR